MVTEREARDMHTAIQLFQQQDQADALAQHNADIATAQQWFDVGIKQMLQWDTTQPLRLQFTNSLTDRTVLEAIRETTIRMLIIKQEIQNITQRIRTIKAGL